MVFLTQNGRVHHPGQERMEVGPGPDRHGRHAAEGGQRDHFFRGGGRDHDKHQELQDRSVQRGMHTQPLPHRMRSVPCRGHRPVTADLPGTVGRRGAPSPVPPQERENGRPHTASKDGEGSRPRGGTGPREGGRPLLSHRRGHSHVRWSRGLQDRATFRTMGFRRDAQLPVGDARETEGAFDRNAWSRHGAHSPQRQRPEASNDAVFRAPFTGPTGHSAQTKF